MYHAVHRLQRLAGAAVLVVVAALLHAGCERDAHFATRASRSGYIAFVGASESDPLWRVLHATAERELAGDRHYKLVADAPQISSARVQAELIRKLRTSDMLGLCVQPVDPDAIRELLESLRTSGVSVVTMMTPVKSTNRFLHSGLDEVAIGSAMADALFDAVDGAGTVAVLYDSSDDPLSKMRYVGFTDRITQLPSVSVLREFDCRGNEFTAQRMAREYMQRFPRLDAWLSVDAWLLTHQRADEHILPPTCKLVTYGPLPDYWPRLTDGTCYAIVGAEYDRVARYAIRLCISDMRGDVTGVNQYLAPPVTVTAKNLREYSVDWFQWRDLSEFARAGSGRRR